MERLSLARRAALEAVRDHHVCMGAHGEGLVYPAHVSAGSLQAARKAKLWSWPRPGRLPRRGDVAALTELGAELLGEATTPERPLSYYEGTCRCGERLRAVVTVLEGMLAPPYVTGIHVACARPPVETTLTYAGAIEQGELRAA